MAYKSQKVLKAEYTKARRNLQQNVRRLAKRGYDVSDIVIPSIPEGKMKQSYINQLNKLNTQRYELSTKIETVTKRTITGEYIDVEERISGKRARGFERRRAGSRAAFTRKERTNAQKERERIDKRAQEKNEFIKQNGRKKYEEYYYGTKPEDYIDEDGDYFIDYVDTGDDYNTKTFERPKPYYDEVEDKVFDPKTGEFVEPSEIDFEQYSYWEDVETGEVYERPKGAKRPKVEGVTFKRVFSQSEQGELAYQRAMDDLATMEQYKGHPTRKRGSKHDATVNENASGIKAFLQAYHASNPEIVGKVLLNTLWEKDYHSPDFMYRAGGYQKYIAYFMNAAQNLGADMDYESEEDYDEGNFDY